MIATGVPMCVQQLQEIRRLREEMSQKMEQLKSQLIEATEHVPQDLETMLRERFNVEGVKELTSSDIKKMLDCQAHFMKDMIDDIRLELRSSSSAVDSGQLLTESSQYHTWPGDDIRHFVPRDYKLPICDVMKMWRMWHCGDAIHGIGPPRILQARYSRDLRNSCRHNLTKASRG